MSVPQLFVLVSTGANVANLPPVLEHFNEGDWIVWVESELAHSQDWALGTRRVLKQRRLQTTEKAIVVKQINDPVQVADACRAFLDGWKDDRVGGQGANDNDKTAFREFLALACGGRARTFLVCNGGNKLTPIGLVQGFAALRPIVLYGDEAPAACWTFPDGFEKPPVIRLYQQSTLDLPEILATSGHCVLNQKEAERFWPRPLPAHLASELYGKDEIRTTDLQKRHFEWNTVHKGEDLPPYEALAILIDAKRLDVQRLNRWKRTLRDVSTMGPSFENNQDILEGVYQASVNLAEDAARARDRVGTVKPESELGQPFERAVAVRVHAWLEQTKHPAVHSAWRRVEVGPEGKTRTAQFDVLLVLKNGILWHLECKSATVKLKELDARILNLQKAGSHLARTALCVPMLTKHAAEPWFAELHKLREKIENLNRTPFVPFTMPDQPPSYYTVPNKDSTPVIWDCPSLESQLEKYLRPFAAS